MLPKTTVRVKIDGVWARGASPKIGTPYLFPSTRSSPSVKVVWQLKAVQGHQLQKGNKTANINIKSAVYTQVSGE